MLIDSNTSQQSGHMEGSRNRTKKPELDLIIRLRGAQFMDERTRKLAQHINFVIFSTNTLRSSRDPTKNNLLENRNAIEKLNENFQKLRKKYNDSK